MDFQGILADARAEGILTMKCPVCESKIFLHEPMELCDLHKWLSSNAASYCPETEDHRHIVEKLPSGIYHGCIKCGYPVA